MPLDFRGVTTLSFDCYGTLIDWEAGIINAVSALIPGRTLDADRILEAYGAAEARIERDSPSLRYSTLVGRAYARLVDELGLPFTEAAAACFAASIGDWPPFGDTQAALASLADRFRLVVLSNVDRESFAKTEARLGTQFFRVFTAEDIGSYKPDLRNFHYMLDRLRAGGIELPQIVHVAQSLYHDIGPARAVGLRTVWVDRRRGRAGSGATPPVSGRVRPDLVVESLGELAALV
jgi:2-haloacid dehalogenase